MLAVRDSLRAIQWILAVACGLIVANLYFAQPLIGLIGSTLNLAPETSGILVTLPLMGYGVGLLTIVPLADLLENRRIVLALMAIETASALSINLLSQAAAFMFALFLLGGAAAAVQILVPYVTYLVPSAAQGKAVGKVVSGIMLGIMLSRPVASIAAHLWGWRSIYRIDAALMALVFLGLRFALPPRRPIPGLTYAGLLSSMGRIFVTTEILRRRALYHACMFGSFSVFWTAVPLWLTGAQFRLSQVGVAWVALAGVAGAIAPPLAGRLADRGLSSSGTVAAMITAALAFGISGVAPAGSRLSLGLVVASAMLLDFAVSANLVFGQRAIFLLGSELRSRLNGLFMATFFAGGALSSALSGWCFVRFGWHGVILLGAALPVSGLLYLLSEHRVATTAAPVDTST